MCVIMRKKYIHSVRYVNDDLKFPNVFVLLMHVMYRKQPLKKKKIDFLKIKNKN